MSRTTTLCLLVFVGIVTVACDKVALLAPTQSTITLSINQTSVASNGTAEVIATVVESAGTAVHDGTEVTFTASVGTVDPRVARTEGGIARTIFRAGTQSGTARIGAFSGAAVATVVELLVGGAAANTVQVRTEPATVPQSGGTVQVIAIVRDTSGNPLANADVVFTADNGSLGSNAVRADQNGEARTTLTTNRVTIVRANVAGKEGQFTVAVVNAPTITLTANPPNPAVGVPIVFTITPTLGATTGNPIQNVTFDPGDGSPVRNLGPVTSAQSVQHTYNTAGSFTARATVSDQTGQRGETVLALTVQRSIINPTITVTPTEAVVGQQVSFTVVAAPAPGGPPIRSVVVSFSDGAEITTSPGQTFSRPFSAPGTYIATARVTDAANQVHEGRASVIVRARTAIEVTLDADPGDEKPMTCNPARISTTYPKTCTTTIPAAGLFTPNPTVRVVFTAGFSGAAPTNVAGYSWSFGDGTSDSTGNRNTDHVYTRAGTYVITVTVTTTDGGQGSQRLTLVINQGF